MDDGLRGAPGEDDPMDDLDEPDDDLDEPDDGSGDAESGDAADGGDSSSEEGPDRRGPPPPENSSALDQRAAGLSRELFRGYRLLKELMAPANHPHNRPFMDAVDSSQKELWDYESIVKKPVWLKLIRDRLLSGEYSSLKELFSDLRLMFRNCYRYNGPQHAVTRRALRLEQLMEQLIDQMEPDLRAQCTLEATEGPEALVDQAIVNRRRSARAKKPTFFSHVLHWVRHERAERDKEYRRRQLEARREQRDQKEARFEDWERRLLADGVGDRLKCMWEFPQMATFIHLSLRALNILEVPLYEMERMLLLPQSSETLAVMMTSLVSPPLVRAKLNTMPPMPYHVWTAKLAARATIWYRAFVRERGCTQRLLETLGIDPHFWEIFGPRNPFKRCLFHNMSYYQRVWMIKTMCDHLFHSHKSLQDCVLETSEAEPRESVVGTDRHGFEYLHFPQLLVRDVRVYRRRPWRAPADWTAPPPPADSPPRLVTAGQRWTKTKLRKLQRKLAALRKQHIAAAPRAARHACLRPATPLGEDGESGEEAEPEVGLELGEGEDPTAGEDGDWRVPSHLSPGRGRGRGKGRGRGRGRSRARSSAARARSAPSSAAPTPTISFSPKKAPSKPPVVDEMALAPEEPETPSRTPRGRRTARRSPSSSSSDREDTSAESSSSSEAEEEEEGEDPGVSAEDETLMASLVDAEGAEDAQMSGGEDGPPNEDESRMQEDAEDSKMEASDSEDSEPESADGEESRKEGGAGESDEEKSAIPYSKPSATPPDDVKSEPDTTKDELKSEPNGVLKRDGPAAAAVAALPELPAPERIPEPAEVPAADPDQFQLVADSFDSLRRLIDKFSPQQAAADSTKKKEWLDFVKRPANYRHPGEAVWREPGDPEPAPPPPPPPPPKSPTPPPSEDDSGDGSGEL
ncbi:uncharacterized protein FJT64_027975 [Amphibalanus amphitrite]|uniref:Bromo domain-containing protein n=1 Tax=Amphibalanus amphitrite TaxID=1232801 RepID=A0A6A4W6E0_AMPAM|nr:uncharacterized protein FJT64_027975 [Amphibalanus amphitrite]